MKKILLVLIFLMMVIPTSVLAATPESVKIPNGPKFWISNVVRGESVTVGFKDYPKGKTYTVIIGLPGNNLGKGYKVGYLSDGYGTNFNRTFQIPKEVRHKTHLAIYIVDYSDNSHGYDIFTNDTGFDHKTEQSFSPVYRSSDMSAGKSVGIFNGPTVWIGSAGYPKTVNVAFDDFYLPGNYTIFIGPNVVGQPATILGYANETNGPRFTKTFDIPDELKGEDVLKVAVVNAFNQHSGTMAFRYMEGYPYASPVGNFSANYTSDSYGGTWSRATPYTRVLNVIPDTEVTLQVFNFPANKEFIVTMGPLGTRGIGGYVIGTQSTGEGGSFVVTYPIPAQLRGSDYISIRLESTSSGHYAYDYFQNVATDSSSSSGATTTTAASDATEGSGSVPVAADAAPSADITSSGSDWVLAPGTYPTTNIIAVVGGKTVTVAGTNFTKNDTYTVRMGWFGTRGINGVVVGQYETGTSSTFEATFNIPETLQGAASIAIRFESNNTPYYAFDWFTNTDTE
ncbi:MAG: hypothetical protein JW757_03330 [Anaerolineales bacterium]|nr:hypothetical protein [Anaerolineales bacterium]